MFSPRRISATSLTMAQLAENSLKHATAEYHRIDEFGRDIHQREWTSKYQYAEERDEEGDIIPDAAISVSDMDEVAADREDSIAEDFNSVTGNLDVLRVADAHGDSDNVAEVANDRDDLDVDDLDIGDLEVADDCADPQV